MKPFKIHYTNAAEADLIAISSYTLEVWGEQQRDFYLQLLETVCESIIPKHLWLARAVPGFKSLLSWRAEHHVVYFWHVEGGIEIIRFLHERQLPRHHLKR